MELARTVPTDVRSPPAPVIARSRRTSQGAPVSRSCAIGTDVKSLSAACAPDTRVRRIARTRRSAGPPLSVSNGDPTGTFTCTQQSLLPPAPDGSPGDTMQPPTRV